MVVCNDKKLNVSVEPYRESGITLAIDYTLMTPHPSEVPPVDILYNGRVFSHLLEEPFVVIVRKWTLVQKRLV